MDKPICSKAAAENFTLLQLWHRQVKQHHFETFRGVGLEKFPQDLWSYEKVIWDTKPTIIFEIGINKGGFSLWLADRLRSIHMYQKNLSDISGSSNRLPKVVGFDINTTRAQSNVLMHHDLAPYIFIERVDVSDISKLNNTAYGYINEDDIVFVIEDSAHNYQTTSASLYALAPLVSSGSYFVVETFRFSLDRD